MSFYPLWQQLHSPMSSSPRTAPVESVAAIWPLELQQQVQGRVLRKPLPVRVQYLSGPLSTLDFRMEKQAIKRIESKIEQLGNGTVNDGTYTSLNTRLRRDLDFELEV